MYNLEGKVQKTLSNNETHFIVDNNSTIVCPWFIRNGATNITETGRVSSLSLPDTFGFFQKVFTGNECITATWENSTKLVKPLGVNAYDYQFGVGKYYSGAVVVGSGEYGTEIESMESMEDFLSMKTQGQITIRFENWVPDNLDLFKLYTLPELYNRKWHYISNVRILNDLQFSEMDNTTSIPACEVTFTSLVDKLQSTGRAVEQFVQYGAIGEPYAYPYIIKHEDESAGYPEPVKEVSYVVEQPRHSRYLQLELFGANAISGIQVIGRKITKNADNTYRSHPWKFLVPLSLYNAQSNDINKTSLATKNFYYFPDETLVYRFSQNLWTAIKNVNDAIATNHNAGEFSMGKWSNWASVPNGEHNSNPIDRSEGGTGMHYDYNDLSWHPILSNYSLSAKGCFYCADTIPYTTSDTMLSILTKNGFVYSTQEVLPLGFYSSKPYKISNLPILGGLISKWGGDWTISSRTKQRKPLSIGYFMDCDIAGMLVNIFTQTQQAGQDDTLFAPTLALAGGEKAPKWLGTTACNTTLLMELTDKVLDNDVEYDTIYFGQNKKEDGTFIKQDESTFLYEGQSPTYDFPTSANPFWFVIDDIDIYSMHNGDIRVSAYENVGNLTTPIFNTTVKSTANWTNSIRDWKTSVKTGCWSDYWCERQDEFTWPTNPTKPMNPSVETPTLSIDNSDTDIYNSFGDYTKTKIWPTGSQTGFNRFIQEGAIRKVERQNYNRKTAQFSYGELGITGVTNRQTFCQRVGAVKFNFGKSLLELKSKVNSTTTTIKNRIVTDYHTTIDIPRTTRGDWTKGRSFYFISSSPLQGGQYNLSISPDESSYFQTVYNSQSLTATKAKGGITVTPMISISLKSDYIQIDLLDDTFFTFDNFSDTDNIYYYHFYVGGVSAIQIGSTETKYQFKVDTLEFLPRE